MPEHRSHPNTESLGHELAIKLVDWIKLRLARELAHG